MSWKTYKDLIVWKKSMELVNEVYSVVKSFPKNELYALTSQMIRSAVSIPSNIAEGQGRNNSNELIRFLTFSRGSLYELETQIIIAKNQQYIETDKYEELMNCCNEVERMIAKLITSLKSPE